MCPDSMEFERDHFKIGDRYGRVLYMQDYASYVKDDMISELCDFSRNLMLSIDILPVPTDEAVREIQNRLLNISENQLSYITNVAVGSGLIRCSGNIVPFENTFPKNTDLYKLMTTKPGES